jgi:hypothetical protein
VSRLKWLRRCQEGFSEKGLVETGRLIVTTSPEFIFGLVASTVLSLLIVPCLYLLFTRKTPAGPVSR